MTGILKIVSKRIAILLFLIPLAVNAQILRDTTSLSLVKQSINSIYNLRFNSARESCKKLKLLYPGNPANYLLNGMITYWEDFPLLPSTPECTSFENDMRKCIEICDGTRNPSDEAEYLLINLSARGFLLLFYSDNDMSKEVFPLAVSTYKYIRRSFDYTSVYSDFYFFTGLYNYYREAFPEAYHVYRPLALLFPKGDKVKGLADLHIAATKSIFYKAEASSFLTNICISFENSYQQAYEHSLYLHKLYSSNIQYLSIFIEDLLLIKNYDEAEEHIKLMGTMTSNPYFKAQLAVYNGILQEKKYRNYALAEENYLKGINEMKPFGQFGNDFTAFSYFGLTRISMLHNDSVAAKAYHKKALEIADFKNLDFD